MFLLENSKFTFGITFISQQGSCWNDRVMVEFTFTRGFGHASEAAYTMCGNPNKVFSTDNSPLLTFRFTWPARIIFVIWAGWFRKKGGFTPLLANHKKEIFPLKRVFLGESQRPVRWLSNRISSFRLATHSTFSTYVQLTFMLHYRIHGFLLLKLTVRKAFQSHAFQFSIERTAMKTQGIWLIFER